MCSSVWQRISLLSLLIEVTHQFATKIRVISPSIRVNVYVYSRKICKMREPKRENFLHRHICFMEMNRNYV